MKRRMKRMYFRPNGYLFRDFDDIFSTVFSSTAVLKRRTLEILSSGSYDGVALAEKLGIAREQVLAMGDSGNDCAMLRYAGVGAAMGNAGEQAKKAADVIAPSNREDGVAWMLRRAARGEV